MKAVYFVLFCLLSIFTQIEATIQRRMAVDIGSGGTKVAIADVDIDTNQIIEIVKEASFPVPYQASFDQSSDGTFDQKTMSLGLQTFHEIKAMANQYGAQKIAAIATSAFRKANNSKQFVVAIEKETGIKVQIIPQREEGEIAFFSALASGEGHRSEEAIVWDIGTGSLQMTTANADHELAVYMGEQMGSVVFKNHVVSKVQKKDLETSFSPNPISQEDLKIADSYARAFARQAYPIIKHKIKNNRGKVLGIGRLFYNSIRPVAAEEGVITRDGLRQFIRSSLNKTDEELNNPFAAVDVTNCILTLAIMKALHIHEIQPIETTTTKGLLISPAYWAER